MFAMAPELLVSTVLRQLGKQSMWLEVYLSHMDGSSPPQMVETTSCKKKKKKKVEATKQNT